MAVIDKSKLKSELVSALANDTLVEKIVVFGSFTNSMTPHDMDVAVFYNSDEDYLPLALALRKKLRALSRKIPVDLLPITSLSNKESLFMSEINKGEVVYEKRH